jgi:hypothetical protein
MYTEQPSCKCLWTWSNTLCQLLQKVIDTLWQISKGYWQSFEKMCCMLKVANAL